MLDERQAWMKCKEILANSSILIDSSLFYFVHSEIGKYKGLCLVIKTLHRQGIINTSVKNKMLAKIDLALGKVKSLSETLGSYPYLAYGGEEGRNERIKFCQERINRMHKR